MAVSVESLVVAFVATSGFLRFVGSKWVGRDIKFHAKAVREHKAQELKKPKRFGCFYGFSGEKLGAGSQEPAEDTLDSDP
jgi:hypothetical protein